MKNYGLGYGDGDVSGQKLILLLHQAFGYVEDNNRDLINDPTFPMDKTVEELQVQFSYQFLISYISRNEFMINRNLLED